MWYELKSGILLNLSLVESLPDPDVIMNSPNDAVRLNTVTGTIIITKTDTYGIRKAIEESRVIG